MKCPRCGSIVGDSDLSCPRCGYLDVTPRGAVGPTGQAPGNHERGRNEGIRRIDTDVLDAAKTAADRLAATRRLVTALDRGKLVAARAALEELRRLGLPPTEYAELEQKIRAREEAKAGSRWWGKPKVPAADRQAGQEDSRRPAWRIVRWGLLLAALVALVVVGSRERGGPVHPAKQETQIAKPRAVQEKTGPPSPSRRPSPPPGLQWAWERGDLDSVLEQLRGLPPETARLEPWVSARTWLAPARDAASRGDCAAGLALLERAAGSAEPPGKMRAAIAELCVSVLAREMEGALGGEDPLAVEVILAQLDTAVEWSNEAGELAAEAVGWLGQHHHWEELRQRAEKALEENDLVAAGQALEQLRATGAPVRWLEELEGKWIAAGGKVQPGVPDEMVSDGESASEEQPSAVSLELVDAVERALEAEDLFEAKRALAHLEEFADIDRDIMASLRERVAQLERTIQGMAGKPHSLEAGDARFTFRWIPPGRGMIGSPPGEPCAGNGERWEEVVFERGFWIGETEVTRWQWSAITGDDVDGNCPGCPVIGVTFEDALEFARLLEAKLDGWTVRLPTEAEWEYACRAGSSEPFSPPGVVEFTPRNCRRRPPGLEKLAWYRRNSRRRPHPVSRLQPNRWGLHDMHGNAAEWCLAVRVSWAECQEDPGCAGGNVKGVLKGGSWRDPAAACRAAARSPGPQRGRCRTCGLRLVVERRRGDGGPGPRGPFAADHPGAGH